MATMPPALPSTTCPHCGVANPGGAAFCESCGKALPSLAATGPRIVAGNQFATSTVGRELQADELHKTAKKASGALLAVAIIQTIIGPVVLFALAGARSGSPEFMAAIVIQLVIAAVFWGLWIWSRFQPLPAAIVGLVLYGTLVAINVITNVSAMAQNGGERRAGGGIGGLGIGWLDIVIMAVLARAISAGAQHRKLMKQSAPGVPLR